MASKKKPMDDSVLYSWAKDEMKFFPVGHHMLRAYPSQEAFQSVLVGEKMKDMWDYITRHVKSADVVRQVKGNLLLHNKQRNDNEMDVLLRKELQEHESSYAREIAKASAELNEIKESLKEIQSTVRELDEQHEKKQNEVDHMGLQVELLNRKEKSIDNCIQTCKNAKLRVVDMCRAHLTKGRFNDKVYFPVHNKKGEVELETESVIFTRDCCEQIELLIGKSMPGTYSLSELNENCLSMKSLQDKLSEVNMTDVYFSLLYLMDTSHKGMKNEIASVDLKKDNDDLRLQCTSRGTFSNIFNPKGDVKTTEEMLYDLDRELTETLFSNLASKLEAVNSHQEFSKMKAAIEEKMKEMVGNSFDDQLKAQEYLDVVFETTKCEIGVTVLKNACKEFAQQAEQLNSAKTEKETMIEKIKENEEALTLRWEAIEVLTKCNSSLVTMLKSLHGKSRLQTSKLMYQKDAEDGLLQNLFLRELQLFKNIDFKQLHQTLLQSYMTGDLKTSSAHRLEELVLDVNHPQVRLLLENLGLQSCVMPSYTMQKMIKLKKRVFKSIILSQNRDKWLQRERECCATDFQKIIDELKESNQKQLNEQLPVLQMTEDIIKSCYKTIEDCERAHQVWQEQPAEKVIMHWDHGGKEFWEWKNLFKQMRAKQS